MSKIAGLSASASPPHPVSVVAGIIMVMFFVSEFIFYLSLDVRDQLVVDISSEDRLIIDMNVTFHNLPCIHLSADAMDANGAQQFDIVTNLYKKKLNLDGSPYDDGSEASIAKIEQVELRNKSEINVNTVANNSSSCGSCYGAESTEKPCCKTCQDVKEAYKEKRWEIVDLGTISQCVQEGWITKANEPSREGCNLFGQLVVHRVAGNFHFAPGHSFQQFNQHVHDLAHLHHIIFNTSHTIHRLSFGHTYPGLINPLDGMTKISEGGPVMYQYFLKVVPTIFRSANGKEVRTNQFSFTAHSRVIKTELGDNGLPGVFVDYDMSPIMVQITESSHTFLHFLTSICAIIGGGVAVAGLLDALIYRSSTAYHKIKTGKLT